jgi:uncharacterized RDD family membrane protein YckC
MRGSNESTPLERSETGADSQFVDLPLFTHLEPEADEPPSDEPLEAEPDATGPVHADSVEADPVIHEPAIRAPEPEELLEPASLEAYEAEPEAVELDLEAPDTVDEGLEPAEFVEGPASLTNRLGAALLDLAVMASAAAALLGGAALLKVGLTPGVWPAFVLPWLAFSFLYHVIPLGFWGRTPGMASMGITARHLDGGSLSFVQATYRWLASLGTTALLGLPGLLAITGRSAADRASESVTVWQGYR